MPYPRVSALSDIGKEHHANEDSWAILPLKPEAEDDLVLLVCDGMGGMGRGDEASKLAVHLFADHVLSAESAESPPFTRLEEGILRADIGIRASLCEAGRGRPGCTAVAGFIRGNELYVSWVGDSPLYVVRDGKVLFRTRDHKLVEDLVESGDLTPAEAKTSSLSSVLTRALGGRKLGGKTLAVAHAPAPIALEPGDRILLCSDGLVDLVSHEEVVGLATLGAPEVCVKAAVQVALDRGGHDNITVIVAEWTGEHHPVEAARNEGRTLEPELVAAATAAVRTVRHSDHTEPLAPSRTFEPYSDTPLPAEERPELVITTLPVPAAVVAGHSARDASLGAPEPQVHLATVAALVAASGSLAWLLVQLLR
jgi:serine/threonine protein phosphatase PrpC